MCTLTLGHLCIIDLNGWLWNANSPVLTILITLLSLWVQPVQCCWDSNCTAYNICTAVESVIPLAYTTAHWSIHNVVTETTTPWTSLHKHSSSLWQLLWPSECHWSQGCRMGELCLQSHGIANFSLQTLMLNQTEQKTSVNFSSPFFVLFFFLDQWNQYHWGKSWQMVQVLRSCVPHKQTEGDFLLSPVGRITWVYAGMFFVSKCIYAHLHPHE